MKRTMLALILAGTAGLALAPYSASAGGLVEAGELEHARANARAGGPVSERDAELLERYGCLSGTNSPACHGGRRYYRHHTYKHHRHRY